MKRAEILQLAMLQPKFAILDETDSGLDADAVRLASQSIAEIGGANMGILIITHHEQLLEHNMPLKTHVMLGGRIVETGGAELAAELHKKGYERIRKAYPEAAAEEQAMTGQGPGRHYVNISNRDEAALLKGRTKYVYRSSRSIRSQRNQQVRFSHRIESVFQSPQGDRCGNRRANFRHEERARLDAAVPPAIAGDFQLQADAALGRKNRSQFPGHLLLSQADQRARPHLGRRARGNQENVRSPGHSRSREKISFRRESAVRKRSDLRLAEGRSRQARA